MERIPMIEVKNLTAKYGRNTILQNISFEICSGEIFMIFIKAMSIQ